MREVSKKAKSIFYFLMFLPFHLFGAGGQNVLKTLETKANEQVTEAGSSAASVINTVITVFGIIWVVVFLTIMFVNIEALKNNIKLLLGIAIILGIAYGLSAAAM